MRPFLYLLAFVLLAGIFEGAFAERSSGEKELDGMAAGA